MFPKETKEHKLIQPPKIQKNDKTETKNAYKILLAFSGLKHALTNNPGYNHRVAECQEAANVLLSSGKGGVEPLLSNVELEVYEAHKGRVKAQNRANVMQLKLIGQSHPTGLTNNLLKLFEPWPPLEYKQPPEKRKCPPYTGKLNKISSMQWDLCILRFCSLASKMPHRCSQWWPWNEQSFTEKELLGCTHHWHMHLLRFWWKYHTYLCKLWYMVL